MLPALDLLYEQVEISQTAAAVDGTDTNAYTFASQSLGAAHSNRQIYVHITGRRASTTRTISTVTVAGSSAAVVSDGVTSAAADSAGGDADLSEFWRVSLPTGTSGDIVVTFSDTMSRAGITVYRVLNASATAHHVAVDGSITSEALSVSINHGGFGATLGGVIWSDDSGFNTRTTTWSGLTENVDAELEATGFAMSSASLRTSGGSGTITATASGSVTDGSLVVISLKPL